MDGSWLLILFCSNSQIEAINEQKYSKKSDIFSYGVVLWEIGINFHFEFSQKESVSQKEPWIGESEGNSFFSI